MQPQIDHSYSWLYANVCKQQHLLLFRNFLQWYVASFMLLCDVQNWTALNLLSDLQCMPSIQHAVWLYNSYCMEVLKLYVTILRTNRDHFAPLGADFNITGVQQCPYKRRPRWCRFSHAHSEERPGQPVRWAMAVTQENMPHCRDW